MKPGVRLCAAVLLLAAGCSKAKLQSSPAPSLQHARELLSREELDQAALEAERGRTAVLVEIGAGEGARRVAFEVEDADDVVREAALPVPRGESLPWASGVARRRGALVPILDLDALGDRIG